MGSSEARGNNHRSLHIKLTLADDDHTDLGPEVDPTPATIPDNTVPLSGSYVTLKGFSTDEEYSSLWRNLRLWENVQLLDYISIQPPQHDSEIREWIQKIQSNGFVVYAIKADPRFVNTPVKGETMPAEKNHSEVLGIIAYLNIHPEHRELEVGAVIFGPALQRSAAATEVNYLMLRNAFEEKSPGLGGNSLPYRRVCWKCNHLNTKSRRAAERLGYVFEGTFRKHWIAKGRSRDSDWLSIIDDEWPVVKASLEQWLAHSNFDDQGRQIKTTDEIRASLK